MKKPVGIKQVRTQRPRPFPASAEARQWAELIKAEIAEWPGVRFKPMFGMTGVYRRDKIFAVLPQTRSLNSPSSFPLKFHKLSAAAAKKIAADPRLVPGVRWTWFEMRSGEEIPQFLEWLALAHRAAI